MKDFIYPELEQTTNAQIEYTCSYLGGYYLKTKLELNGRGIKSLGDTVGYKDVKKTYRVTDNALTKLKTQFSTCYIASL